MITIRTFRPDDWKAVKSLRLKGLKAAPEAFTETYSEAKNTPDQAWQEQVRQNSEGNTSIGVLASEDTNPIGMAVGLLEQADKPEARLAAMWISSDFRGKGIATSLVQKIVEWAGESGCESLVTCVTQKNSHTKAFYTKLGFKQVPDQSCDEINLRLPLKQ